MEKIIKPTSGWATLGLLLLMVAGGIVLLLYMPIFELAGNFQ